MSIQDPIESKFIEENVEILQDSAKTFWIGMYKTHEGEVNFSIIYTCIYTPTHWICVDKLTCVSASDKWMWIDDSPLDYTNWKSGMPQSESCVYISSYTGLWSTTECRRSFSFICKTPKGNLKKLFFLKIYSNKPCMYLLIYLLIYHFSY